MLGHELIGLGATIIGFTFLLAALRGGSTTATVLKSGSDSFANLLYAMQGISSGSTAQAGA